MNNLKNNPGEVTFKKETPRKLEELVSDFFSSGKKVEEFEKELDQNELTIWKSRKNEFLFEDVEQSQILFDEDEYDDVPFFEDSYSY